MTLDIEAIEKNEKYRIWCKKISGNSSLWRDLHQEFLLLIMEKPHLYSNLPENELDWFFYGTINRMWQIRNRKKTCRADTNPLYQIKDNPQDVYDYVMEQKANLPSQAQIDLMNEASKQLKRILNGDNKKLKKQAKILLEYISGKSRLKISVDNDLNYRTVHIAVDEITDLIKSNMTGLPTKNDITIKLRAEGITCSYSGKTKTFYINGNPSEAIKALILKAGYKIESK